MEAEFRARKGGVGERTKVLQHNFMAKYLPWVQIQTPELQRMCEERIREICRGSGSHFTIEDCLALENDSKQLPVSMQELPRKQAGTGGTDV